MKETLDLFPEIVGRQIRCVDQDRRPGPDRLEKLDLALDPGARSLLGGQGVAAAGLRVSVDQHIAARVQVQDIRGNLRIAGQAVVQEQHRLRREIAVPGVDAQRKRPRIPVGGQQTVDQRQGQVVDRLEPHVFEHVDRGGPAGAGGAGDQNHACLAGRGVHGRDRRRQTGRSAPFRHGAAVRTDVLQIAARKIMAPEPAPP